MKTLSIPAFAAACLLTLPSSLHANLLIYEGFSGYSTSGTLNGQTAVNTVGLNAATITGGGTLTVNTFETAGLTFSNLQVSGGNGYFTSQNTSVNAQSYIGYTYSGAAVTGSLYTSYLTKIQVAQSTNSVVSLRANLTASTGSGTSYFVTMADSGAGTKGGNQYDAASGTTSATAASETPAVGTTYIVIGRFTNVGTTLSATTVGSGTTFILTEAQFDHFKIDGFTDAELDAAPVGTDSESVFSRIKDPDVTSSTHASYPQGFNRLVSGEGIQFGTGNAGIGFPQTVKYDEIRYGTSLSDVLPVGPAIDPNPALVSLEVTDAIATEPTASTPLTGKITLRRLDGSTQPVTVNFAITGTAINGTDYSLPLSATIPSDTNSQIIEIKPFADRFVEPDETVIVTAISGSGYTLDPQHSATVTIQDGPFPTRSRLIENLAAGTPQKIIVFGTSLTADGAWPGQVKAALDASYPGLTTLVNSGGSGMNSDWGIKDANLKEKVINLSPNAVFIEFATNDAVNKPGYPNLTPTQARTNLNFIITSIQTALPNCEIILQVMSPVVDTAANNNGASYRTTLPNCQQNYRDAGKERGLLVIDHMGAWQALLDQGNAAFLNVVADGLHPGEAGYSTYVTPTILREIGAPNNIASGSVMLHTTNQRNAEPTIATGSSRSTKIVVTRGGPTTSALVVPLTIGGTSTNGGDYPAIPSTITIPAGASSASVVMNPLADVAIEGEETFTIGITAGAGVTLASPNKASLIIEDRPFDNWRKAKFTAAELLDPSISGDNADPDNDGIKNLVEFYTNHLPKTADATTVAVRGTDTISASSYLTLTYDRVSNNGLSGIVQTSGNLTDWQSGGSVFQETILTDTGLIQTIKARSLTPITGTGKEFIRLKVTRDP